MFLLGQFRRPVEVDVRFKDEKIHLYLQLIAEFGSIAHMVLALKTK